MWEAPLIGQISPEYARLLLTNTPTGYIVGLYRIYYSIFFEGGGQMGEPEYCSHCSMRTKERSEEEYKKLMNRLNRIEGQIRGLKGMLERDAYCTDILVQSSAVSAALNAFNKELLANHIRTCVAQDIREDRDEVIDDLLATLQKLMR